MAYSDIEASAYLILIILAVLILYYKWKKLRIFIKNNIFMPSGISDELKTILINEHVPDEYMEKYPEIISPLIEELESKIQKKISIHGIISSIFLTTTVTLTALFYAMATNIFNLTTMPLSTIYSRIMDSDSNKITKNELNKLNETFNQGVDIALDQMINGQIIAMCIGFSILGGLFTLIVSKIILSLFILRNLEDRLRDLKNIQYEIIKKKSS